MVATGALDVIDFHFAVHRCNTFLADEDQCQVCVVTSFKPGRNPTGFPVFLFVRFLLGLGSVRQPLSVDPDGMLGPSELVANLPTSPSHLQEVKEGEFWFRT